MRPHHIIHVSGVTAFLAVASSAILAYTSPSVQVASAVTVAQAEVVTSTQVNVDKPEIVIVPSTKFGLPMTGALDRVTKKTFGLEVHPATSPVEHDRFNGFHVGVDFEVTEEEKAIDMPVFAICDGPLIAKQYAGGYGGYALQSCELDGEPVVVLYGHLHLESIQADLKHPFVRGETIGFLGEGYSKETDGVRKHLHLGVHRGTSIDIRGYVPETSEINGWLDVLPYLKP